MITRGPWLGVQLSTAHQPASDYAVPMEPLLVVATVTLSGVVVLLYHRLRRVDPSLGFVSQQWLTGYRASQPS
jgi:hypothetical protein